MCVSARAAVIAASAAGPFGRAGGARGAGVRHRRHPGMLAPAAAAAALRTEPAKEHSPAPRTAAPAGLRRPRGGGAEAEDEQGSKSTGAVLESARLLAMEPGGAGGFTRYCCGNAESRRAGAQGRAGGSRPAQRGAGRAEAPPIGPLRVG